MSVHLLEGAITRCDGFLAPELCALVIARAETAGFAPARLAAAGRRNQEAFFDWPALRDILLGQLRQLGGEHPELCLDTAILGPRLECYRYEVDDQVAPHVDAPLPVAAGLPSSHTLLVYLDECASGGETVFPDHAINVRPSTGTALLFVKPLRHAGARVRAGRKHVLRADLACVAAAD